MQEQQQFNVLLFDLDGTLVDTAPAMALTLNLLLKEQRQPELAFAQIRPYVSHGVRALLQLGFPNLSQAAEISPLRQRYLQLYQENIGYNAQLFPGMEIVLETLAKNNTRWGIVTNKPSTLTESLLEQLGLSQRAHCVVSGDTVVRCKPYPDPLWYACTLLGCEVSHCLFIGDAQQDVQAGNSAGMATLVALYGYLSAQDQPLSWGALGAIKEPSEILHWF